VQVRSAPKKGLFSPKNDFEYGKFYYIDVPEMAAYTGSEPVLVDQTFGFFSYSTEANECRRRNLRCIANGREWDPDWTVPGDNPSKCASPIYCDMVSSPQLLESAGLTVLGIRWR
jgi:hypothetical protein